METQITEYSATALALDDLDQRYGDLTDVDPNNQEDYDWLKDGIKTVVSLRTSLEKKRKELKAPILERGKLLDAEAKAITSRLTALETPMKELKNVVDEREKREKEERLRILDGKVQQLIEIGNVVSSNSSSAEIEAQMQELEAIDAMEGYFERTTEACEAKGQTMNKLVHMLQIALDREEMKRRIEELEAENRERLKEPPPETEKTPEKPAERQERVLPTVLDADLAIEYVHALQKVKVPWCEGRMAKDLIGAIVEFLDNTEEEIQSW